MYYIVLENTKRHIKTYDYYNKSSYRASTHNQLQLDLMRKSLGKDLSIQGYGTNEMQKLVWAIEDQIYPNVNYFNPLHHFMNGHIIEVTESYEALWFKLNDTNVTKNNCRFKEIYSNLDRDYLLDLKTHIDLHQKNLSIYRDNKSIYVDFVRSCNSKKISIDEMLTKYNDKSISELKEVITYVDGLITSSVDKIEYYKKSFETYLTEHRTV